jgi:signal peptidase I
MSNEAITSGPRPHPGAAGWPVWLRIALIGRRPKFTLLRVAVLVVMAFVIFGFVLLPVRIQGPSMMPTYRNGGFNVVNRLAYFRHEPQRGDVVAIRISGEEYSAGELVHDLAHFQLEFDRLFRPSLMYMKRIVGMPGETIAFSHGRLLVNGKPLDEPYHKTFCDWERPPQTLGPHQYFVLGDNRTMRMEDHTFLAAERSRIVGKVML